MQKWPEDWTRDHLLGLMDWHVALSRGSEPVPGTVTAETGSPYMDGQAREEGRRFCEWAPCDCARVMY